LQNIHYSSGSEVTVKSTNSTRKTQLHSTFTRKSLKNPNHNFTTSHR
jgi:hypothetical protein